MQNAEGQVQQDGASALHRVLCAETFAEKERRLSEMILQLQLLREQLLQQQDQSKPPIATPAVRWLAKAFTHAHRRKFLQLSRTWTLHMMLRETRPCTKIRRQFEDRFSYAGHRSPPVELPRDLAARDLFSANRGQQRN
ncbi:unnamed protein product [Heterotrigona itama]|uniref:Uncharacterized protein n=1 Tax=Heterotrigona itama TaxID=395501 RepID=A0A6V7H674_9HYME|nr:unnamed protein product [Heterotrigona itama]